MSYTGQSRIDRSVLWIDPVTSQQLLQTVSGESVDIVPDDGTQAIKH